MCGIAGWVRSVPCWNEAILRRMTDAIAHRGPDGDGAHFAVSDGGMQVALGHRRLAIIDPAGGAQPVYSECGRYVLVYNGEIYNYRELRQELAAQHGHRFYTHCDSEVLLAAYMHWGEACLERLRGMFAFALWDAVRESLFLARDRFGKKPLYLVDLGDGIAFASEIKALLALPGAERRIDETALRQYLVFRYVPGPRTFFAGIAKLPPGCCAVYREGRLAQRRYYVAPDLDERAERWTDADAIAHYESLLEESVRLRLASDVPFGAYLSGGVDSSAIVALMSRNLAQPVRTFSIGFSNGDPGELPFARLVADRFRTEHHEVIVAPEDLVEALGPAIVALDGPVSEPATIPLLLLSRHASRHVKMVLSGEGADEFLGGYAKHSLERFVFLYQRIPPALQRMLRRTLAALPSARAERAAHALDVLAVKDPRLRFPLWFSAFGRDDTEALWAGAGPDGAVPDATAAARRPLRGLLFFDQTSWLPDNLLERGDRMTMAAGIEARMPFMDHELAAFTARLPDRMRIRGWTGKWLLRRAMRSALPPAIFRRRKRGFPVPLAAWFRDALQPTLREVLLDASSLASERLGRARIETMIEAHRTGAQDATKPLWLLLNLDLFRHAYRLGH